MNIIIILIFCAVLLSLVIILILTLTTSNKFEYPDLSKDMESNNSSGNGNGSSGSNGNGSGGNGNSGGSNGGNGSGGPNTPIDPVPIYLDPLESDDTIIYNKGCRGAFFENLFPFDKFDNKGEFTKGLTCSYYKQDNWGFGNNVGQINCSGACISGAEDPRTRIIEGTCSESSPPISPNVPWNDEQCSICATAALKVNDNFCKWVSTKTCPSGYTTNYKGIDIDQCYYNKIGNFGNNYKLCCVEGAL